VYRAYDTSEGIEVAWNTVNITPLPREEKKRIMNEVRLLQNLEHKNLVQFHGSWVNREKEQVSRRQVALVRDHTQCSTDAPWRLIAWTHCGGVAAPGLCPRFACAVAGGLCMLRVALLSCSLMQRSTMSAKQPAFVCATSTALYAAAQLTPLLLPGAALASLTCGTPRRSSL
jgi:hypothetical protein